MRMAVLSDLHYSPGGASIPSRRGEIADILLLRAIHRLNRFIKPDVVVLLGDLVDPPNAAEAETLLAKLAATMKLSAMPWLAIPGNHDPAPDRFHAHFPKPPDWIDVADVRLVPFIDPEEPEFNARRDGGGSDRMKAARTGWNGPIVALHHVPVFPPGLVDCPYNYTNAEEVIAAMRANGVSLAVGGHFHPGFDLVRRDDTLAFAAAPALCEAPFAFYVIEINGQRISLERHELRMPPELKLVDTHIHTHLAYCSENMDIAKTRALAKDFGLAGLVFAEHSGQLYFNNTRYWNEECLAQGMAGTRPDEDRTQLYFGSLSAAGCPVETRGLEIDAAYDGSPLVRPEDEARVSFRVGAVHGLPSLRGQPFDVEKACDEFLFLTESLLRHGVNSIAHPFRVFRRRKIPVPESLFEPMVALLRRYGVAAEINFHTNEPHPDFVRHCIDAGVKLTFGSDAHNLYEVGEFAPHLALLRSCGFDGDVKDILSPQTPFG